MSPSEPVFGQPPIVGRCLDVNEWYQYIERYPFGPVRPTRVVLHHTWKPTQEEWRGRPTILAIQRYYRQLGWSAGPHLFAAPDGVWLFSPLDRPGIHAGAGNGSLGAGWYSIGVEMVGNFDKARPAGKVWHHTLAVLDGLTLRMGGDLAAILRFHRDYSKKSCPGRAVTKSWVLSEYAQYRGML